MRTQRRSCIAFALAAGAWLCASPRAALATYSIAAVDSATRQVGGAGASCIGDQSARIIYGVVPGRGVVHAQALINTDGRDEAVTLLARELAPADIIARVTAPEFDPMAAMRQYGVVDLSERAAGFTGRQNGEFAGDIQGQAAPFTFTVQGNILTGPGVLDRAAAAFEAGGCDLAERLMLALEAGAEDGEGDSRCTPSGVPADSAFLEVDLPDAKPGSYLVLDISGTGSESAVALLREQYDAWRTDHPCPAPEQPDAAPDQDAAGPPSGSDAGPDSDGSTGGDDDEGDDDGDGGGCHTTGERDAPVSRTLWLLILALGLAAIARRAPIRPWRDWHRPSTAGRRARDRSAGPRAARRR
jgi:uncharacterized Ntn-hydrolase superfamily protein